MPPSASRRAAALLLKVNELFDTAQEACNTTCMSENMGGLPLHVYSEVGTNTTNSSSNKRYA
jgi:hypothetical protein